MPGGWSIDGDDDDERSLRAAANAKLQMRRVAELVETSDLSLGVRLVTVDLLCELNHLAVDGLVPNPGKFRVADVEIVGSKHTPPAWQGVPALMDAMLEHLHQVPAWEAGLAVAYLIWRLNWIHPFEDGNGRTARAAAYLLVCVGVRGLLPGETTWIELLAEWNKIRYWRALQAADGAWREGRVDVTELQELVAQLLLEQLDRA